MMLNLKKLFFVCFLLSGMTQVYSQVTLPRILGNGMVLQRNTKCKIWGWSSPYQSVHLSLLDSIYTTEANADGEWTVVLAPQAAGGPYNMAISSNGSTLEINNVLFGEVWFCSGQSNMELPMRRVSWVYPKVIAESENPYIRQFYLPRTFEFKGPRKDLEAGAWISADPEKVLDFSATAYFFARELYEHYKVPIGIINSALGGSPIESWLSEIALQRYPESYRELKRFQSDSLIAAIRQEDNDRWANWHQELYTKDAGKHDPDKTWEAPELDDSNWAAMQIPGYWNTTPIGQKNGVVWFRKNISVPEELANQPATLILGRIVDADSVYINGSFVGTTGYQYPPRRYPVPNGVLKSGKNSIVVRIISSAGRGGFMPEKPYQLAFAKDTLSLTGDWKYKLGAEMPFLRGQTFIRWKPGGLYNAMTAPLLNYAIKGVVWYQGESDAGQPVIYHDRMISLIQDWRYKWQQKDLPFLYVQLPNYMQTKEQPGESNWARLRYSQLQTLSIPYTGMAVTIDIGEWNDIHPLNKKDVGHRLALNAYKVAYGEKDMVYSGPIYKSMQIDGNKIILSFSNIGSGLQAKGDDELHEFTIAGKDGNFIWANAKIDGKHIVVWSDEIENPVVVRYAWADNPDKANLYNKEGLPASPFSTDPTE